MKHYLMDDVWKLVGIYVVLMLIGFFAVDRLARAATGAGAAIRLRRHGRSGGPAAAAGVFGLVSLVLTPVVNAITRHIEHEADRFGLE
jgi:STE24 endopeptidase